MKGKETMVQEGDLRPPHSARNKSGIWGWRSEKMEVVSGYEAKVSTELWGAQWGHPGVWQA